MAATNFARFYGSESPDDVPRYSVAEASRYLDVPYATVRSWFVGTTYRGGVFAPVIRGVDVSPPRLSFNNLIEVHVLRALRTHHGHNLRQIRAAIASAQTLAGVDRLLLSRELRTDGGANLLLDEIWRLTNLTKSGQLGMRKILEAHLERIDRERMTLFPFVRTFAERRDIAINPTVSFGKPVVARRGISTAVIAKRLDAGETKESLAADYELDLTEIEMAAVYELAA